jgi:hypothetical protein
MLTRLHTSFSQLPERVASLARAMMAHPDRHKAQAIFADAVMSLYPGPTIVRFLINETARSELANLCIVLAAQGSVGAPENGLTMGRIQQIAADLEIASPGRTFAFVKMLEVGGFLEKVETHDRRLRCLRPSDALIAHQTTLLRGLLGAADLLLPQPGCVARFDAPDGRLALVAEGGRDFLGGFRIARCLPLTQLFAGRDGGFQFLLWMLKEGGVLDCADPGEPELTFSLSHVGPRFGLSRPHLRTLLREAEAEGLVTTQVSRTYTVVLRQAILTAFAEHVTGLLAYFADLTLNRLPAPSASLR